MLTKLTQYLLQSDIDLYFSSVYLEQMNLLFLVIGLCIDIQYLVEEKTVDFVSISNAWHKGFVLKNHLSCIGNK